MSNRTQWLSTKTIIVFGAAVFAMHFGGSCMLWPVTWGQQSGASVLTAMVGIFFTALLLPYLAYVGMMRSEGSFWDMASRINPQFGFIFGGLTIAVLGPLFVIPRMSTAAWEAMCQVFGFTEPSLFFVIFFQVAYYLVAYLFLFQRGKIMDKLGEYLTPILVITVICVVAKSLLSPASPAWTPQSFPEHALKYGLISGYQTGDLPGSLIFGGIIIFNLKAKGLAGNDLLKNLLLVTAVGFAMLTTTHFSQMLVGASTGAVYEGVSYARLYATIVLDLWGMIGGTLFNIALLLAALTSAIGLSGGCANFFVEATGGKWSYKPVTIVILVISAAIACFELNFIVKYSAPLFSLIYPPCIALVITYIICGRKNIGIVSGATIVAFCWGVLDMAIGYFGLFGADLSGIKAVYSMIPLATYELGWVIPSIVGAIVGHYAIDRNGTAELATA